MDTHLEHNLYYQTPPAAGCSRQILAVRQIAIQWTLIDPGNGADVNFWYDPWTKYGQLINFIGPLGPRQTGIPISYMTHQAFPSG